MMASEAHRRALIAEKSLCHEELCIGHDSQKHWYHCYLSKSVYKVGLVQISKQSIWVLFPKLNELVSQLFVFNTGKLVPNAEICNLRISF